MDCFVANAPRNDVPHGLDGVLVLASMRSTNRIEDNSTGLRLRMRAQIICDGAVPDLMRCEIRTLARRPGYGPDASHGWLNSRTEQIAALKQRQHERAIDLVQGSVVN